jgi:hypothetical protein
MSCGLPNTLQVLCFSGSKMKKDGKTLFRCSCLQFLGIFGWMESNTLMLNNHSLYNQVLGDRVTCMASWRCSALRGFITVASANIQGEWTALYIDIFLQSIRGCLFLLYFNYFDFLLLSKIKENRRTIVAYPRPFN